MNVPLFASRASVEPLLAEVAERQRAVLESGRYILGPEVEGFESEFAQFLGAAHCVGVANGTDAIQIGLRALGVGPGHEVVVPALTFFATAEAILAVGATPVFVDIDPETYCIDPVAAVERAITARTRALLPVHLFGHPAELDPLLALADAHGLEILEDVAQAAGATYRRPQGRHVRRRVRVLVLPVEEPRSAGRRGSARDRPARRGRTRPPAAHARPGRPLPAYRGGLHRPPRRDPGRGAAREAAARRPVERRAPARRGGLPGRRARRADEDPGRDGGLGVGVAPLRRRTPSGTRCAKSSRRRGSRPGPTTRSRSTASRRWSAGRRWRRWRRWTACATRSSRCRWGPPSLPVLPPPRSPRRSARRSTLRRMLAPALPQVPVVHVAHLPRGHTGHDRAGLDVGCDDRAGGDERLGADLDPGQMTAPPPTLQARRSTGGSSGPLSRRPMVLSLVVVTPGPMKTSSSTTVPAVT